ncbi:MAG: aldolase/citrate lyase family protein [Nocardioidaceae bacterium]
MSSPDVSSPAAGWVGGPIALGVWLTMREPVLAEHSARLGYDYACVDMQHGFCEYGDVATMLHALSAGSTVPIVRVPVNEPSIIGRVLDLGALGVIVPMVDDAQDARRAVAACRYPPAGERSFGPLAARVRHGEDYAETADQRVLCLPMIETARAVENIEAILSVPGVDGAYVGPADLSLSMGLRPGMDLDRPQIRAAVEAVAEACGRNGQVAGTHVRPDQVAAAAAAGLHMATVGGDLNPVLAALREAIAQAREGRLPEGRARP